MYIKNQTSLTRKILYGFMSLGIIIGSFGIGNIAVVHAQEMQTHADKQTASQLPDSAQESTTDQIILKYKSTSTAFFNSKQSGQMDRLRNAADSSLEYLRPMSGDAIVLRLPERIPLEQVWEYSMRLNDLPEVDYAVPDQLVYITATPNDPHYANQWDLFESWGINAPSAWDITTGSSNIVVAVLDTGITNHVDLSGRTVSGYDFVSNVWTANDGDGRDSNPSDPGDWVAAGDCGTNKPAQDSSWHGTHVAGTIGAKSNNNVGVTGINWNSMILPVRVLGRCGGYDSDIIDGMRWAAGLPVTGVPNNLNPAKVLNMSLSNPVPGVCSFAYITAINDITSAGSVIVVAAGNDNDDALYHSPGNCGNVITVAATNRSGNRASYSNFGSAIEISAPGGQMDGSGDPNGIFSTLNTGFTVPNADPGGYYGFYQGTSQATPHVSGVVSLMLSRNPYLNPSQVLGILQKTSKAFPVGSSCNTSICGTGVVDAGAAVRAVPLPTVTCPQSGGVILYYNANYDCNGLGENNGYVQRGSAGWQNITGGMNENASSMIMPSGWSVLLYENANRGGGKKCLNSTDAWLSDFNYLGNFPGTSTPVADHASSFDVFTSSGCGAVVPPPPQPTDGIEVCDLTNYGAPCKTYTYVNNDACTNLNNDGWNNRIESLRFKGSYIGGYEIILYDDNSCGTYIARPGSDVNTLGLLNNLTGSFRIEQKGPPPPPPDPGDKIVLYDGTNYGGESTILTYVDNNFCTNLSTRSWSDRADSLQFFGSYISNYDVVAYDDTACNTYIARYGSNMVDLGDLKNRIASVRIEQHGIIIPPLPDGSIKLWDGSNYSGSSKTFPYDNNTCTNLLPQGWDNRARSLQFIGGYIGAVDVILHDDNNCNTYVARYGSDASTLGAWDGKVGSIRIERHAPPKPDLIPYPRSGRSNPVIISPVAGTSTNGTLYAGEPVYIDWGFKNNGSVGALAFNVKLTINGQTIIDYPFGGLSAGSTNGFDDWSTTWITPGTFPVILTVDSNSAVDESDEGNNTWTGQFTWNLRSPNLFTKSAPLNGAVSQLPSLNLTWTNSSGVNNYAYCLDTNNNNSCDTSWVDTGTSTSAVASATPGSTYYWQVRASNSGGDTYADGNTWRSFSTVPSVPNDDFNNAVQISTLPYINLQTTIGATSAGDDPAFACITGQKYNAVWYKFIPSVTGVLDVNTIGSSFDTVLGVWSGNRGSLVSQACNDDASGLQSEVQVSFVAGTVYYIEVAGYSADSAGTLILYTGPYLSEKLYLPVILR